MQLVTIRTPNGTTAGRLEGDDIVLLDTPDVGSVLRADGLGEARTASGPTLPLAGSELAPVVTRPDKIICIGINYADHVAEMGHEMPDHPTYFAKYHRALIGAVDDIWLPHPTTSVQCDWEAELVIVVGRNLRHATPSEAAGAIAGFTVGNDFSVRDWQRRSSQFLAGKTFEHASPVGPVMVTTDELGDGDGLPISSSVNGVVKQDSNTSHLVFGPVDILTDLSRIMTLDPGDMIFTGTPGGVGAARTPPEWLVDGDVLTTRIEGIGVLENRCVVPADHPPVGGTGAD